MAELKFEAPLAEIDGEDWNDFNELSHKHSKRVSNPSEYNQEPKQFEMLKPDDDEDAGFGESMSGSLEDLVSSFDNKLTKCFSCYKENVNNFAPVQVRSQEDVMKDCQMWWTITGNFGNILPIDWSKSYTKQLHTKSLRLQKPVLAENIDLDLSEDEELVQAFDTHSLIIDSPYEKNDTILTADEVISDIEKMMENQDDLREDPLTLELSEPLAIEDPLTRLTPSGSELLSAASSHMLKLQDEDVTIVDNIELRLRKLSCGALSELNEELEATIKDYSEALVCELDSRDELEYEKELKNQFINLLLGVQKRRRDLPPPSRVRRHPGHEPVVGTFLTTVIPYHAHHGVPTLDNLQIFTKILSAISQDSPTVPAILTDYILKVHCPTS